MPTFLHALTLITLFSAGAFFLITVGATLLWLAEVLEQNPKDARRWGKGLIYAVSAVLGLLYLVDSYPGKQTLLSGVALLVYLRVVTSSPTPSLSAPTHSLVLAIVLLPITHFAWYWHFMHAHQADVRNRPTYGRTARVERAQEHKYDSFDRLVFYALCVWLVPFYVFLSLSSTPTKATSPSSSPSTALFPPPQDSHLASLLHRFLPRKYFRSRVDLTEGILSPRPLLRPRAPSAGPLGGGAPRSGGLNALVEWPSSGEASSSRSPAALGRSVPMRRISSTTSLAPSHLLGASPASPTSTEPGIQSPTDLLFVRPPSSLSSQHDPSSPSGKTSFALGEAPSRKSGGGARQVPSRSATLGSDAVDRRRSIAEDV